MSAASTERVDFEWLLITDGYDQQTAERVAAALTVFQKGSAAIQLRCKALNLREQFAAAQNLREITRKHQAKLLINDRFDLALAVAADGVHLPENGVPIATLRAHYRGLIGASTHGLASARAASQAGADYLCFGPIFATASKLAYGAPLGLNALQNALALPLPVFAIGGIDVTTAATCRRLGARLACIGAVLGNNDPAVGARTILAAISDAAKS